MTADYRPYTVPNISVTSANYFICYPLFISSFRAQLTRIFTVLDSWHQNQGFSMFWVFVWSLSHLSFPSFPKPWLSLLIYVWLLIYNFSDWCSHGNENGGLDYFNKNEGSRF